MYHINDEKYVDLLDNIVRSIVLGEICKINNEAPNIVLTARRRVWRFIVNAKYFVSCYPYKTQTDLDKVLMRKCNVEPCRYDPKIESVIAAGTYTGITSFTTLKRRVYDKYDPLLYESIMVNIKSQLPICAQYIEATLKSMEPDDDIYIRPHDFTVVCLYLMMNGKLTFSNQVVGSYISGAFNFIEYMYSQLYKIAHFKYKHLQPNVVVFEDSPCDRW